jgi:hypothetical protein
MTAIQSIFSLPRDTERVSFTINGEFHYSGHGYAYIIRPSKDGAVATLRISRALLHKFRMTCFREVRPAVLPDMEVLQTGPGWWKVVSMSEAGDTSVHRFFYHLNKWALARQSLKDLVQGVAQAVAAGPVMQRQRRCYKLKVMQVGKTIRVLDSMPPTAKIDIQSPVSQSASVPVKQAPQRVPSVEPSKLAMLAQTINNKYGHLPRTVH